MGRVRIAIGMLRLARHDNEGSWWAKIAGEGARSTWSAAHTFVPFALLKNLAAAVIIKAYGCRFHVEL